MPLMNQEKLNRMCRLINKAGGEYAYNVTMAASDIADWFNENWISSSSKHLASNIQDGLKTLNSDMSRTINDYNRRIRTSIYNYNNTNDNILYYPGFYLECPNVGMLDSLNQYLYNGKVGSTCSTDDLKYPFNHIRAVVQDTTQNIKKAIVSADALTYNEQQGLQMGIIRAERKFTNSIDELEQALNSKVAEQRDLLQAINGLDADILKNIYF